MEQIAQSFPCENHCVTKCSHEDCGLCYLHIHIFFLYIHSPLLLENKVNVITVFLSKLDRPLFNYIYYETVLVWGFVSIWLTNPTHYSMHHVSTNPISFDHYCFLLRIMFELYNEWIYIVTESILLASSIFPNNEWQITDAYSEPCQTLRWSVKQKRLMVFCCWLFLQITLF